MRVLITCFSSISNVAAIVPQLYGLTCDYPEHEFIVLSRSFLRPLFDKLNNVTFVGGDIRGARCQQTAWKAYIAGGRCADYGCHYKFVCYGNPSRMRR